MTDRDDPWRLSVHNNRQMTQAVDRQQLRGMFGAVVRLGRNKVSPPALFARLFQVLHLEGEMAQHTTIGNRRNIDAAK